ncbi:MAG: hypothetical protein AB4041_12720 [Microcystaceae cyanobacterium]
MKTSKLTQLMTAITGISATLLIGSNNASYAAIFTDTLEDIGTDGTIISSRIIGGVEVSLSTDGGFPFFAFTYFNDSPAAFGTINGFNVPLVPTNVSGTRFISSCNISAGCTTNNNGDFISANPIIFNFSPSITSFGLTSLDLLETGVSGSSSITLSAFDVKNNLIDSQTRTGSQGGNGLDLDWFVSSPSTNITRVTFSGNINTATAYGIDDLIVGVEPESIPESSNILGLFLVAGVTIFTGIKFKKKEDFDTEEDT